MTQPTPKPRIEIIHHPKATEDQVNGGKTYNKEGREYPLIRIYEEDGNYQDMDQFQARLMFGSSTSYVTQND